MSTIASPRDSSVTSSRRLPALSTPTSSSRPSLDSPRLPPSGLRSSSSSPNRGPTTSASASVKAPARRNRAALREYYNLKAKENASNGNSGVQGDDGTASYAGSEYGDSEVQESEMDRAGFDGEAFVKRALEGSSLEELLGIYNRVLTDIRALDAEKKALVYDNYSRLITATETIRRMRANMDPLNPMAITLDPAIAHIYEQANRVKQELKDSIIAAPGSEGEAEETPSEKKKATMVARKVLDTPRRVRELVADGREDEARREWAEVLTVLESWRDVGKGGRDVQDCIDDGEAALRGEPPSEKSWISGTSAP